MNHEEREKDHKLEQSVFFVEATSEEQFFLWKENKNIWEQDYAGFLWTIGNVKDDPELPITVSFSFNFIYGQRVCFYYTSGRYNDSVMVEEFLKEKYPVKWDSGTRIAYTNAANFHHAVNHCKTLKEIELSST